MKRKEYEIYDNYKIKFRKLKDIEYLEYFENVIKPVCGTYRLFFLYWFKKDFGFIPKELDTFKCNRGTRYVLDNKDEINEAIKEKGFRFVNQYFLYCVKRSKIIEGKQKEQFAYKFWENLLKSGVVDKKVNIYTLQKKLNYRTHEIYNNGISKDNTSLFQNTKGIEYDNVWYPCITDLWKAKGQDIICVEGLRKRIKKGLPQSEWFVKSGNVKRQQPKVLFYNGNYYTGEIDICRELGISIRTWQKRKSRYTKKYGCKPSVEEMVKSFEKN